MNDETKYFYITTDRRAVWRESWPEIPSIQNSINRDIFLIKAYEKTLESQIKSALPVHGFTVPDDAKAGSFVEVIGRVEVVQQYRFKDTDDWMDIDWEDPYDAVANFGCQVRTIARLKKPENSAISEVMKNIEPGKLDQHYKGEPRNNGSHGYSEGAEMCDDNKLRGALTIANKNTERRGEEIKVLTEQLAAANKRIAELEQPLKARILEAFADSLSETGTPGYCCNRLSEVLDELNIK